VQLGFTVARVPPARPQPEETTHVAAAPEAVRILYGQHVRQRNQRTYTVHLFQGAHLGMLLFGDLLNAPVIDLNLFAQCFLPRSNYQWLRRRQQFTTHSGRPRFPCRIVAGIERRPHRFWISCRPLLEGDK